MGADFVYYVSGNSDKVLVAWSLGPIPLGLYSLAFRVLQVVYQFFAQVGRVILPTFARLQDDRERLARVFLHVSQSVALALSPAMTLVVLCAPIGVPAVFGEAWSGAVVPFQLVAAMTTPLMLASVMGPLTIAVGRPDWEFRWAIVTTIAGVLAFSIGLLWGIVGVAAAYLIVVTAQLPIRLIVTRYLIPIETRDYYRSMMPAAACSIVLAVAWITTEALLRGTIGGVALLTAASTVGGVVYVGVLKVGWPDVSRRQFDFFHSVVRR
jgi:O-antigen/teichoic acid export membrane protein